MNSVKIHVPYDSGFASGGGTPFFNMVVCLLKLVPWFFHPRRSWKDRKEARDRRLKFEEKNLREGKNADGSYSKAFPASMTLGSALTELGFNVMLTDDFPGGSVVKLKRGSPLSELTAAELEEAVRDCQIATW